VTQPESLFTDAPLSLVITKTDLTCFVRGKASKYFRHEDARRTFVRKYQLGLEGGGGPTWDALLDALFVLIVLQSHRRRQLSEAGAGLRGVYLLADTMRRSAPRVPIRRQEGRVVDLIDLQCDHPVLGQVTTVLHDYGLVYLHIGWRRPACVQVREWTPGLRALRRGDRCLVWVLGLQRDKKGQQLVLATFEPPGRAEIELDLPRGLLRQRLRPRRTSLPKTDDGPALPPLISVNPGGERPHTVAYAAGAVAKGSFFNHPSDHTISTASLSAYPSVPDASVLSMHPLDPPRDPRPATALSVSIPGHLPHLSHSEPQPGGRHAEAQQAATGAGGPPLIETLLQELQYGREFEAPPCELVGLAALGHRLELERCEVDEKGRVTLCGPIEAVLEGLDRVIRVCTRWAMVLRDPVLLAGLDIHYVSQGPVVLPLLQSTANAVFNGPLNHPYHALEEEMWPRRFTLCPNFAEDAAGPVSQRGYLIAAESMEVAEAALDMAYEWERNEVAERRSREQTPMLYSPTSGNVAAHRAQFLSSGIGRPVSAQARLG
jgi:hypothetical protein